MIKSNRKVEVQYGKRAEKNKLKSESNSELDQIKKEMKRLKEKNYQN